jgi:hypothetical protein
LLRKVVSHTVAYPMVEQEGNPPLQVLARLLS